MNKETVEAVVRHVLTFGGGYAVQKGVIDEASMLSLVGATATIAGIVWSLIQKREKNKEIATLKAQVVILSKNP